MIKRGFVRFLCRFEQNADDSIAAHIKRKNRINGAGRVVSQNGRLACLQNPSGAFQNVRFETAAAHGAEGFARIRNQHSRAQQTIARAFHVKDGR